MPFLADEEISLEDTEFVTRLADSKAASTSHSDIPAPARPVPNPLAGMLQRIWLRVRRRKAWLDSLSSSDASVTHADFFQDADSFSAERAWQDSGPGRVWTEAIRAADGWMDSPEAAPLRRLAHLFQISRPDLEVLQASVALRLDPALGPVFGYLQGNPQRTFLSAPLAARLFLELELSAGWRTDGSLAAWKFIRLGESTHGESEPLISDPVLPLWLTGEATIEEALRGPMRKATTRPPLQNWPVEALTHQIRLSFESRTPSRYILSGPPQSGRTTLAAIILAQLGTVGAQVDTDRISDDVWPDVFLRLQRFARWTGAILIWRGKQLDRPWPAEVEPPPLQFATLDPEQTLTPQAGCVDHQVTLPPSTAADQTCLWSNYCSEFSRWNISDQHRLITGHRLLPGQIAKIGARRIKTPQEALQAARETTRAELQDFGQRLPCGFRWDDLILKPATLDALRDLSCEAQERAAFWDNLDVQRLFPRGAGLTALFSGDPGTGKTMAAQIIAAELDLDLVRIDLARVVSKYIGETAKHLREIFRQAAGMSAVLLFDEADALFAKRTDVRDSHDRYANADTGYLLQLLEEYRGLAILTTNKRGNVDPAFFRRLRYVFEFPKPGPEERNQIWQRVLICLVGTQAATRLQPTTQLLASQVDISAAQIKNALLASVFICRRHRTEMQSPHLLLGLDRELAKEGRATSQSLRQELLELA